MLAGSSPLAISWANDVFRAPGWKGGGLQFMVSDSVPTVRPEPSTPFAARACGPLSDTSPCVTAVGGSASTVASTGRADRSDASAAIWPSAFTGTCADTSGPRALTLSRRAPATNA